MRALFECILFVCLQVVAYTAAVPLSRPTHKLLKVDAAYKLARATDRHRIFSGKAAYVQTRTVDLFDNITRATTNANHSSDCLVEGDINVCGRPEVVDEKSVGQRSRAKRQISNAQYTKLWPNNTVTYAIDESTFSGNIDIVRAIVNTALANWASKTCLKFRELSLGGENDGNGGVSSHNRDNSNDSHGGGNDDNGDNRDSGDSGDSGDIGSSIDYARVYSGFGCWSYVGRLGGAQDISLQAQGCLYNGVVMHEFGHALGLIHEQSRPDRDRFVKILPNNINPAYIGNFFKTPYPDVLTPTPYDINSVMHYGLSDFAPSSASIGLKDNDFASLAGNRVNASHYDFAAVNVLYQCRGDCPNNCMNDGYSLKKNGVCTCVCPYGLGGSRCETFDSAAFTCGGVISLSNGAPFSLSASSSPRGGKCSWLFQAPPGFIVKISFGSFSVAASSSQCTHTVDIRRNLIGQPGPYLYCGVGIPDDTYTRNDFENNAAMVIFDYSSNSAQPSSFQATVSAYFDGCLGDPCRGAACQSYPGSASYSCILPSNDIICGFEDASSVNCSPIKMYDKTANYSVMPQRTWEITSFASTQMVSAEGSFYITADDREGPSYGTFRIIPYDFKNASRCLKFKYYLENSGSGVLNIYRAINGTRGMPIFTVDASANSSTNHSHTWISVLPIQIQRPPSSNDLVEVIFEATQPTGYSGGGLIGIDDVRYLAGACAKGPCSTDPCGTSPCVETETTFTCLTALPDYDASCSFEDWEDCSTLVNVGNMSGDSAAWRPYKYAAPGRSWPYPTGPSGPATGLTYLYGQLYDQKPGSKMRFRLLPFKGNRCLRFKFSMSGTNVGTLSVYRAVNGSYSTATALWSAYGNQGNAWLKAAINVSVSDLPPNSQVEIIIEGVHGSASNYVPGFYAADLGIDDIYYSSGTCERFAGTNLQSPLATTTTTTTTTKQPPKCRWVYQSAAWKWICS